MTAVAVFPGNRRKRRIDPQWVLMQVIIGCGRVTDHGRGLPAADGRGDRGSRGRGVVCRAALRPVPAGDKVALGLGHTAALGVFPGAGVSARRGHSGHGGCPHVRGGSTFGDHSRDPDGTQPLPLERARVRSGAAEPRAGLGWIALYHALANVLRMPLLLAGCGDLYRGHHPEPRPQTHVGGGADDGTDHRGS
jgi:hypothetical protein